MGAMVLLARTGEPEDGARGVSAFFVPMDEPGITATRFNDMGTRPVGRGSVFFDDVKVPADCLMGEEGTGFVQVMQGFDYSRALIGLQCVAAAQASLDEAWAYATEREAFGMPLARYQGVTFPLAEAETMLNAARLICYETLDLRDRGLPHTSQAAMAKWFAPKTAVDVIHQCLLTHGHYGYTMDLPHQQRMRDVMGLEIGDGTAQIMKLIIAREKVGRVAVQYDMDGL
jgi:cyclohexanecarboxyl-CoA dehydrogenase